MSRRAIILALAGMVFAAPSASPQWRSLGLSGRHVSRLYAHDGFLYACTMDGLHRLSLAAPDSFWSPTGFSGHNVFDVVALGPHALLASKGLTTAPEDTVSLFRSTDGGDTWQPFQNGFGAGTTSGRQARRLLGLPGTPGTLLAASGRIEKSADGGASWRIVVPQPAVVNALEASPADPQILWVGGETVIFSPYVLKSTDAGESWKETGLFAGGDNAVDAIAGDPTDPSVAYLGMEGRVMKTEDGGASWTLVTSPDPSMYTFGLAIRPWMPLKVYAAGASYTPDPRGVVFHQSLDGGLSWQALSYPAAAGYGTNHLLLRTGAVEETLYVATGNGVFCHTQGIVDVPRGPDADGIALRCHPNPFSRATTIEFTLSSAEAVTLCVLDVQGRIIATPCDAVVEAGRHRVPWDAPRTGNGIYLALLKAGHEVRSVKVLRIR